MFSTSSFVKLKITFTGIEIGELFIKNEFLEPPKLKFKQGNLTKIEKVEIYHVKMPNQNIQNLI